MHEMKIKPTYADDYGNLQPNGWSDISTAPDNVVVWTIISDHNGIRNEQTLKRDGNMWWMPDGSMYVYYRPTHWKPV